MMGTLTIIKTLDIPWEESEWFILWLKLARRRRHNKYIKGYWGYYVDENGEFQYKYVKLE